MKFLLFYCLLSTVPFTAKSHPGIGIVKDSKGNIYYTDLKQVWKITADGKQTIVLHGVHTHELYMDANDDLFGEHLWYNGERLNTWGHYVWCRRSNGKLDTVIKPSIGFLDNYSFVRDSTGNMYFVQREKISRIKKVTKNGITTTIAEGEFKNLRWMHSTEKGVIYFVDLTDLYKIENGKVQLLAKNLHEKTSVLEYGSLHHNVFGIWLDKQGNVYVAGHGGQVVKKVSPTGKISDVLYSTGTWRPCGGLFDEAGNLWLMESDALNEVRVRKINKDMLTKRPPASVQFWNKSKPILISLAAFSLIAGLIYIVFKKKGHKKKPDAIAGVAV